MSFKGGGKNNGKQLQLQLLNLVQTIKLGPVQISLLDLKEYSREVLAQESADFTQGPLMSSCKHF